MEVSGKGEAMRLIDADALKAEMIRIQNLGIGEAATMVFCAVIDGQPETIVRCKDCKWGEQSEFGYWLCGSSGYQMGDLDGNGFCSDGERRTDEQTD